MSRARNSSALHSDRTTIPNGLRVMVETVNRRIPVLERSLLFGTPLPPLFAQNLENKRFILAPRARSLSLKELHAKSREHWSYGPGASGSRPSLEVGQGLEATPSPGYQIVKELDYLADNVSCSRLSEIGHAVNEKALRNWELGRPPGLEKPARPGALSGTGEGDEVTSCG